MPPENDPPPTGGGAAPPAGGQQPAPPPPAPPKLPEEPPRAPPGVPEGLWREHVELRQFRAQAQAQAEQRQRLEQEAAGAAIAEARRIAEEAAAQSKATLAQLETERLDKQLLEANPAALAVPERRAYFRDLYDQRADKTQTPQQWLASEAVTKHPVASLLLTPPAGAPPPPAPNPQAGAQPGNPAPHGTMSDVEIQNAARSPAAWKAAQARARAALEQRLGVSIAPSTSPKPG